MLALITSNCGKQRVVHQLGTEMKVLLGRMEAADGMGTDTSDIERKMGEVKIQIKEKGEEKKAKSAEVCARAVYAAPCI